MVSFICDACGQTVKKQKVEKHYQTECHQCSVLSCIDCGKDFPGDSYVTHTSCISEAEKYQGKLFKAKEKANKGEKKQQEWIEQVRSASNDCETIDPRVKKLMARIMAYDNIPRKEKKFKNFCENSVNVRDSMLLQKLWEVFSGVKSKDPANNEEDQNKSILGEDNNDIETVDDQSVDNIEQSSSRTDGKRKRETCESKERKKKKERVGEKDIKLQEKVKKQTKDVQTEGLPNETCDLNKCKEDGQISLGCAAVKFKWGSIITKVLKCAPDHEMSVKKLRKKVLNEYVAQGGESKRRTDQELRVLFKKKIHKNPKIKVHKEKVKLL